MELKIIIILLFIIFFIFSCLLVKILQDQYKSDDIINFHYNCDKLNPCCFNINSSILHSENENNYFIFNLYSEFNQCQIIWSNNKRYYFTLNSDGIAYIFDFDNSFLKFKTNIFNYKEYNYPFKIKIVDNFLQIIDRDQKPIYKFDIRFESNSIKIIITDEGNLEFYNEINELIHSI